MMSSKINKYKNEIIRSIDVKTAILEDEKLLLQLERLAEDCITSLMQGGKIILAGNGGSFADAQHLSAEFTSRFRFDRNSLASIALGTNSSSLSAIGNDYGFEFIFSRELESVGRSSDIFISISTSGNSKNIINAIKTATKLNIRSYCFTGSRKGIVTDLCECICVPAAETERIQECHILLGHLLCGHIEDTIFNNTPKCD
jgi:D-sedoheptulose 7-phosphate isomerase